MSNICIPSSSINVFKSYSLPPKYWRKAFSPSNYSYEFETIDNIVSVEPYDKVLPTQAADVIRLLHHTGAIQIHQCYHNSLFLSLRLTSMGYNVKCVDGFCMDEDGDSCYHRFCEYDGKYFDATLECLFSYSLVSEQSYTAVRIFEPHELLAAEFGFCKYLGEHLRPLAMSTLPRGDVRAQGRWDNKSNIFLDNEGFITTLTDSCDSQQN